MTKKNAKKAERPHEARWRELKNTANEYKRDRDTEAAIRLLRGILAELESNRARGSGYLMLNNMGGYFPMSVAGTHHLSLTVTEAEIK